MTLSCRLNVARLAISPPFSKKGQGGILLIYRFIIAALLLLTQIERQMGQ